MPEVITRRQNGSPGPWVDLALEKARYAHSDPPPKPEKSRHSDFSSLGTPDLNSIQSLLLGVETGTRPLG